MKINTRQGLVALDKTIITDDDGKDFTVGLAISNILSNAREGDRFKLYTMAVKFYDAEEVDIDKADVEIIKTAVMKTELYNNLINGQLLEILLQ